ncbi:glycosyltransferase [Deltaproteobacteria bacterium IMCC39524]|nr:glycosyltransferase [Deltaproteobacteria bacterium IMCC39524]
MIFVTVGTQLPFDRLIRAVDEWSGKNPEQKVYAQISDGKYQPNNFPATKFLTPDKYRKIMLETKILVAHAGTGSILTAIEYGLPVILMPRKASLGEHRNEHQLATAENFKGLKNVYVAINESELDKILSDVMLKVGVGLESKKTIASDRLISVLSDFVNQ